MSETKNTGPLAGIKVLDMSRILAGPSATQILGDLGADVVKVERPGMGDDTRKWGPPYVQKPDGTDSTESAYYLSCNRNKRSIAVDYTNDEGRALIQKLARKADIVIENFKTGTLARYGLDYDTLKKNNPGLIYCSLTGFGQTGPYADRAGYDFLVQGMGGIMSLTGPPEGEPYKTGVAIADLMAGMYALTGILAALHHRNNTGEGQLIDVALLDTQIAWLSNAAQYYLTGGKVTPRMGNAHPTIVPYEAFAASDGYIVLAIGNDDQFRKFCDFAGRADLHQDARYTKNADRVRNRETLIPVVREIISKKSQKHWIDALEKIGVPCGPVNNLAQVFADPQVQARKMTVDMPHPDSTEPVTLIANPLGMSQTPVSYRHAPPKLGEHSEEILKGWLG